MRRSHLDCEPDRPAASTIPLDPIVQLWILRILLPLGGLHRLLIEGVGSMPLLERVGLRSRDIDDEATTATRERQIKRQLKPLLDRAERSASEIVAPQDLADNVARLAALVHLSDAECRILEFASLLHGVRELDDVADALGHLTTSKLQSMLQHILALPGDAVKQTLRVIRLRNRELRRYITRDAHRAVATAPLHLAGAWRSGRSDGVLALTPRSRPGSVHAISASAATAGASFTAQYFTSAILPQGSRAALVSRLAAASA